MKLEEYDYPSLEENPEYMEAANKLVDHIAEHPEGRYPSDAITQMMFNSMYASGLGDTMVAVGTTNLAKIIAELLYRRRQDAKNLS